MLDRKDWRNILIYGVAYGKLDTLLVLSIFPFLYYQGVMHSNVFKLLTVGEWMETSFTTLPEKAH